MYIDAQSLFSNGQTIATAAGDTVSANTIDFGSHGREMGDKLRVFAQVTSPAASAGAATLKAVLQQSSNNSDWVDVMTGPTLALADIVAGAMLFDGVPFTELVTKRYLRVSFTGAVADFTTAPKVTAGIIEDGTPVIDLSN